MVRKMALRILCKTTEKHTGSHTKDGHTHTSMYANTCTHFILQPASLVLIVFYVVFECNISLFFPQKMKNKELKVLFNIPAPGYVQTLPTFFPDFSCKMLTDTIGGETRCLAQDN